MGFKKGGGGGVDSDVAHGRDIWRRKYLILGLFQNMFKVMEEISKDYSLQEFEMLLFTDKSMV